MELLTAQNKDTTTIRSEQPRTHSVAVIGVGYVGLPLLIRAAHKGLRAVGFDVDVEKVARLSRREAPYISEEEQVLFKSLNNISVTATPADIWHADTYIICVPTPVRTDHTPDLEPLKKAAALVGRHLSPGALVIIESTVNPGACEEVALPIIERESGLVAEKDFFYAHCPERINPGDQAWDVGTIPRVLGASGPQSLTRAYGLYSTLIDAEVRCMPSIKEAEAVKMVENAFRDINIAFVNELAQAFDHAGLDLVSVIEGASTKPFSFMPHFPGCGVGGHCIPVDPYYLIRYGEDNGFDHGFLLNARRVNTKMPRYAIRRLLQALKEQGVSHTDTTVALLGLSYKKDISDTRESPAMEIKKELEEKGIRVRAFDPFVPDVSNCDTLEEALEGSDAALIATDHTLFRTLTPGNFNDAGVSIVIDGRNCLDKNLFVEAGLCYRGIGR